MPLLHRSEESDRRGMVVRVREDPVDRAVRGRGDREDPVEKTGPSLILQVEAVEEVEEREHQHLELPNLVDEWENAVVGPQGREKNTRESVTPHYG